MNLETPGYRVVEKIFESSRSVIYRAIRDEDGAFVAVKTLYAAQPSPRDNARFRHEYQVQSKLSVDGVARVYDFLENGAKPILLLEYVEGGNLQSWMPEGHGVDLEFFFRVAIQLARTLGEIHRRFIIHKDIKPDNILCRSKDQQIKIIDFGISTELSREKTTQSADQLVGSLAFISPEQTGRMNRAIDYRTDLYSLGMTFYRMLAGRLAFHPDDDPLAWIHCHIAKQPEPLHQVADVPPALSAIVTKLISKNAEDRYKSAFGLEHDLRACQERWKKGGDLTHFVLGRNDFSDRFEIPQKLYGRKREISQLMDTFGEAVGGSAEMAMVSGWSGIGKSALVHEVLTSIISRKGYFIEGKFDQFQRNIPYSALAQAFRGLMRQLLVESPEKLEAWKQKLLDVLGPNGQLLIELLPELEQIIGPQPPLPHLGTEENQNRFNSVFQSFLQLFAKKEHPMVLFIDDLQWVDSATLSLIRGQMLRKELHYFLFIGAYRDNEVDARHPLIQTIDELERAGLKIRRLTLKPLALDHIRKLLADTINLENGETGDLASLVLNKTGGNPFFINQFLKRTHERGFVAFDVESNRWQWDLEAIREEAVFADVVDLMVSQMEKLPEPTQKMLRLGACIGNVFKLKTLSIISELSLYQVARDLWPAVKAGMLLAQGEGHRLLTLDDTAEAEYHSDADLVDRFLHDKVQQAAYSLIEESQRQKVHLRIGRLLLQETPEEELEESLFDIVEHFNQSIDLIDDPGERHLLATLNLKAGKKAKESTAYQPAFQYFTTGLAYLGDGYANEGGRSHDRVAFELGKGRVACGFLRGDVKEAIQQAEELLDRCESIEDKVEVNNILILHYGGAGQMDLAIDIALDSLRHLGVHLPRNPNQLQLLMELARSRLRLGNKGQDELFAMPLFQDERIHTILSLLRELIAPTYLQGLTNLLPYIILRMFNLTLKHGNGPVSAFAYSGYALLWAKLDHFKEAHRFGVLAMGYNGKVDNPPLEARCYFMATSFALYWRQPLVDSKELRKTGRQKLIDTGENFWASYIYLFGFWQEVVLSKSIEEILDVTSREIHFSEKANQIEPFHVHTLHRNLFQNLAGGIAYPGSLDYEKDDEAKAVAYFKHNVTSTMGKFYHVVCRLVLHYYHDEYEQAAAIATRPDMTEQVIRDGTFTRVIYTFFTCMAILEVVQGPNAKPYHAIYRARKKKLRRWYTLCEANFSCMWHLLLAEEARFARQETRARQLYERAIEAAKKADSLMLMSLAAERFGKFWLDIENQKIAAVYLTEAMTLYSRWGASGKRDHMEVAYPWLAEVSTSSRAALRSRAEAQSSGQTGSLVNADAVEQLLKSMVESLVEHPEREGFLLLEKALSYELAARFYLSGGMTQLGMAYLTEAYGSFRLLGDQERMTGLLEEFPDLDVEGLKKSSSSSTTTLTSTTHNETSRSLDLKSIIRTAQDISGVYQLPDLLEKIMTHMMENAGAQRAWLVLDRNGALTIEAEAFMGTPDSLTASAGGLEIRVLQHQPLGELPAESFPFAVVHYVFRTAAPVILNHAMGEGLFMQDPYVQAAQAKSVLCMPLLHHGVNRGVLYLENNLAIGVFTPARQEILSVLCSQAVITIQTAELYSLLEIANQDLEKKVEERTNALQRTLREIEAQKQEIIRKQDQLVMQEKMASLGTMIAGIAHEIKNPLNFILNFSRLSVELLDELHEELASGRPKVEAEKMTSGIGEIIHDLKGNAQAVRAHGKRANGIVQSMMEMAQESQDVSRKQSINAFVEEYATIAYYGKMAQGGSVDVELLFELDPDLGEIEFQPRKMARVVANLVNNAIEAVDAEQRRDGEKPQIMCSTLGEADQCRIRIRDNGVGIPAAHQQDIFTPFFSTKPTGLGNIGLGLSAAYDIVVKEHQGTMKVNSREGEFTEVEVTLPRTPA